MKKIISYSLYGSDPKYLKGVNENIQLASYYYPDWTLRLYTDQDLPEDYYQHTNVEIVKKKKEPGHLGLFWRFEPLMDISIDYIICRDLDSRLGPREVSAVNEWIESGKSFHIMRDHLQHGAFICGGMWGASNKFIQRIAPTYSSLLSTYLQSLPFSAQSHHRGPYFNTDQPFLWRYVWPMVINNHIAHIRDLPNLRFTGNERLFPIENPDKTFVGQPI